nr:hypothetical protein [Tanacetum cinerariifolium]
MAALYISDKLSEAVGFAILEDKIKVAFSQARESDQAFIDVLCDLWSTLRVIIMKDRRLVAKLEAGQRADTLKPLEYMGHIYTPSFKTLGMAALYISDKLSEAVGFAILEDKIKVAFSQARESDQAFIDVLCDLWSTLRVIIMKDRRLVAKLEAGQRADTLKPLEYMGMRFKAGFAAEIEETG